MGEIERGEHLVLRRLGLENLDEVMALYQACPTFFLRLTGSAQATVEHVHADISEGPPGFDPERNVFIGLYDTSSDELVGCANVLVGWPEAGHGCFGLLLVSERQQRRGLGREASLLVERFAREQHGVRRMTLGVELVNAPALQFWQAMGYRSTGERFENLVMDRVLECEAFAKLL